MRTALWQEGSACRKQVYCGRRHSLRPDKLRKQFLLSFQAHKDYLNFVLSLAVAPKIVQQIGAEDGASTPLLVNTGAALTTLTLSLRPHLHPVATIIGGSATVGSYTLGSRWLLPALRVGTLSEPNVAATVADEGDAVLGLDVLTRFTLFLDFRSQQALVQRAPDYDARRGLQGWTGLRLGQDNTVEELGPSSPACKAGVRMGDRLLTIDGKPFDGISDDLVQKMLDGEAGTPLTLTLARGSAPAQTIIVSPVREFDASLTVLDGVMLHKADKPYLAVQDVAPGTMEGSDTCLHCATLLNSTDKTLNEKSFPRPASKC